MTVLATLFEPAEAGSSVSKSPHDVTSSLRTRTFFSIIHLSVSVRNRWRQLTNSRPKAAPPGPQDFSPLLRTYQKGKNKYASKHGVHLDWFLPATEPEFASSRYTDWSKIRVLRFQPKDHSNLKRTVVYFNGGGFISPATEAHSSFCCLLAHWLQAAVYMFPYELAPSGIAASQTALLTDFYLGIAQRARKEGKEIVVGGDSAGGLLASCLPQCITAYAPLLLPMLPVEEVEKLQPDQLILIAPLTTCNLTQDLIKESALIEPQDFLLNRRLIKELVDLWIGTSAPSVQAAAVEHYVSKSPDTNTALKWKELIPTRGDHPILDPFGGSGEAFQLAQRVGIHVTLLCGTHDTLWPFSSRYAKGCEEYAVRCSFIEGLGGIHAYPIFGCAFGNAGCDEGTELIIRSVLEASRLQ